MHKKRNKYVPSPVAEAEEVKKIPALLVNVCFYKEKFWIKSICKINHSL